MKAFDCDAVRNGYSPNRPRKGAAQLKVGHQAGDVGVGDANRPRKGAAQLKDPVVVQPPQQVRELTAPERGRHN